MADLPIFGGYNDKPNIGFDSENLVNLFMLSDPLGKKKNSFLGLPGLRKDLMLSDGTQESRQLYTYNELMVGVFGSDVYRFTKPLVKTRLGEMGTSRGYVSIATNNAGEIGFVDGQALYVYNSVSGAFAKVTSEGVPPKPLNVVNLGGFWVVPYGESSTYGISGQNQGTMWDAIDSAVINSEGGNNVGVGVVNERLYFFKELVAEVWYNAGASDFPFRKDINIQINSGCWNASTIVNANFNGIGVLMWLARDRNGVASIMMGTGQMPTEVSNESISNLIATFSDPSDATAYIFSDLKHTFYVISWTKDDTTLVYDLTTKIWSQWQMHKTLAVQGIPNSGMVRHLSQCHAYFNNTHYIGSYKNPWLYSMRLPYATNDGEQIRRSRITPHFFNTDYKNMQISSIQIDMQMGLGLSGETYPLEPGINPKVFLRISRDGGNNFGNYHEAIVGRIGNRLARARFLQLGICRDLVCEISFSDPVIPVSILGASIDYKVLAT